MNGRDMSDRAAICLGALAGAFAGGVAGYLYFTKSGRRLRAEFEPRMRDFLAEVRRARFAAVHAVDAAGQGWQSVRHLDATLRSNRSAGGTPVL